MKPAFRAIPQYPGYHPQQQIVFQYSLHILEAPDAVPDHHEHLSLTCEDPSLPLLVQLREDIGDMGSVLVWNKAFEMARNTEMAALHPEYAPFLEGLNQRVYDLGDPVRLGYYLHPGFKGSWSIKQVLPVVVPIFKLSRPGGPSRRPGQSDLVEPVFWLSAGGGEELRRLKR